MSETGTDFTAKGIIDRVSKERTETRKKGEIVHDGYNVVSLTDLGLKLESVEDKIIVMMDQYKTGYECKQCDGAGFITEVSVVAAIGERRVTCPACSGKGHILIVPESSKSLPTSGVVLSIGEKTRANKERFWFNKLLIKLKLKKYIPAKVTLGARVIFSPHVGTLIPFKGNITLKIMREHEPLAVMYGADVRAVKDFMEFDTDFREG